MDKNDVLLLPAVAAMFAPCLLGFIAMIDLWLRSRKHG